MKHCHNCKHLEYIEAELHDENGWACNGRKYKSDREEEKHLRQLDNNLYRFKGKRCWEAK